MKNNFTGIGDIFKFSFVQTVKSKAFIITQIILCSIALLSFPLVNFISNLGDENGETVLSEHIDNIYIKDSFLNGKLGNALLAELKASEEYKHCNISVVASKADNDTDKNTDKNKEEIMESIKTSENGDVYITIDYSADVNDVYYGFSYNVYYGENVEKLDEAANELSMFVDDLHEKIIASVFLDNTASSDVITDEFLDYVASDFSYEISLMGVDNQIVEKDGSLLEGEYWLTYAFLMISIFAISIGGSKVAEQLVTEKSTKVIEYIMTSVKPMSLITGKVLASVASVMFVVGSVVASLLISGVAAGALFPNEDGSIAMPEIIVTILESDMFVGVTPLSIVVAVLLFLLGILFYGFIGGVAGATVSKIEEMAEGMKLFTFTMLMGAYLPMFLMICSMAGIGDWGIVTDIIYVLPITSVFILPAYILIGKVSLTIGLIALAVMIVSVLLMVMIVSKIFEYLIYYNGSPLKFKDLIRIYKDKRRAK